MRKLLIATRNKGKLPEIQAVLEGLPYKVISLSDVPSLSPDEDVEEPAMTFEGNAIIKAIMWGKKTGVLTLADDSGLAIDALGGRPGVFSARYAPGTDEDRYEKMLEELKDIPTQERSGRYRCVAALYDPDIDKIRTCEGVWEIMVRTEAEVGNGFGYDPITVCVTLGKSGAQMTREEKNSVSHRGKAMRRARKLLETEFLS